MRIDCYCSVVSPFTYLAWDEPQKIADRHGAELVWIPADFARIFEATGGLPLPKRAPARQAYRLQELPRIARRRGLPLNVHPAHWPTDQAPAHLALCAASRAVSEGAGGGDLGAAVRALARACWAEEKDVADPAVVAAGLAEAGFDPALAHDPGPEARKTFDANTDEAIARGAFGAPFYIVGEEKFWGQDRLDYLDDHLARLAAA
ncbi:MAG: 2-hydroxychromene-2-carboxylate isomerase [Pseudomonadota bacterium]